jgi:hypothetical protein
LDLEDFWWQSKRIFWNYFIVDVIGAMNNWQPGFTWADWLAQRVRERQEEGV